MLAHQLHCHITAAFERDEYQFLADGFLQQHGDDLVFLLGAGSAHFEGLIGCGFDSGHVVGRGFVRCVGMHPKNELVQRQHRYRCQVTPIEGHASGQRGGEQVGQRDDDFVRIALVSLDIQKTFSACATGFIHHDDGLGGEFIFGCNALDKSGHLVCATAGAGGDDEFDGLGGLPGESGCDRSGECQCYSALGGANHGCQFHAVSFLVKKIYSISGGQASPACSLRPGSGPARSRLLPFFCHLRRAASGSRSARFAMSQKSTPRRCG